MHTDVAEKYFSDSERHYTQVLYWAIERLSIATESSELNGLHLHTHTRVTTKSPKTKPNTHEYTQNTNG